MAGTDAGYPAGQPTNRRGPAMGLVSSIVKLNIAKRIINAIRGRRSR